MAKATLLVIGARGFIGGTVARAWRAAGGEAVALIRSSAGVIDRAWDRQIEVPQLTMASIEDAIADSTPDFVLHGAGTASVEASLRDPAADFAASVGTLHAVLEAARRSSHRPRILYPSSAAVYGQPDTFPIAETAPARPISPYGHHKAIAEMLAQEYAACFGVPVLIFRLFSVFGPHQRRLLIHELFEQFRRAEFVTVQGSGDEMRDFLHEHDLGTALISILPHLRETLELLNLATGRGIRVRDVAELMRGLLDSDKPIRYAAMKRPGDPTHWIADTSRLRKLEPVMTFGETYDFKERLRMTLDSWISAGATPSGGQP
jgi:UDP-glucose 4-epimerase